MFSRSTKLFVNTAVNTAGFYYFSKKISFDYSFKECLKSFKPKLTFADATLPKKSDSPSSTEGPLVLKDVMLDDELESLSLDDESKWDANWDKKACMSAREGIFRRIILIRHGDYHKNGEQRGSLNNKGIAQAKSTGNKIKRLYQSQENKIGRVIYSSVVRAIETTRHIGEKLDLNGVLSYQNDLLREGHPCRTEPPSAKQPAHVYFRQGAQIEAGFRDIFFRPLPTHNSAKVEIYVCHANVIRYFLMRALQFPKEMWGRIGLENGSITEILIHSNGEIQVVAIGEHSHHRESEYD